MKKLPILLILSTLTLCACSVLPYEEETGCSIKDNFGNCQSISDTYNKKPTNGTTILEGEHLELSMNGGNQEPIVAGDARNIYIENYYKEITGLIRQPQTPIMTRAVQMRTLILSHSNSKDLNILYLPRYVYTIIENPRYVLKPYMHAPEQAVEVYFEK